MKQIYRGAFIVSEYNKGQITIKAYCGTELIDKQVYIGYLPSTALKLFKSYLDTTFFQFNTITI
jgi:hypothetical protein